jgi:hypothetical protein
MQPGDSLLFGFDSTDSPATLGGNSPFFPSYPIYTSYIYGGAPFSGPGYQFLVQPVPEPAPMNLLAVGALAPAVASRRWFKF